MRAAAIVPVKSFSRAKTRLGIPAPRREELCRVMLEAVLRAAASSRSVSETVVATADPEAAAIAEGLGASALDCPEEGVNAAVAAADRHVAGRGFAASVVLPQDIPYVRARDIDFVMGHASPPSSAVVVPSRRFDGTNALVRVPARLMGTSYDDDSYRAHMAEARRRTPNAALVLSGRIMADVDTAGDLEHVLGMGEDPALARRMAAAAGL